MIKILRRLPIHIFLSLLAFVMLFPLLFTLTNSFMSGQEIISRYSRGVLATNYYDTVEYGIHFVEFSLIPFYSTLQQYIKLLFFSPLYLNLFWNSLKITIPVVIGQLVISAPAAFAFEYAAWKHKEKLYFLYIIVMLMPLQVMLVPNFIVAGWLNIRDSYLAIILPGVFNPFGVFLIRQQLKGFPIDYWEAAQIDGVNYFTFFIHVVLPASRSTIIALGLLTFVEYWNLVDQAIVFIKNTALEPLSVFLSRMVTLDAGLVFATAVLYTIPALLLFFAGQNEMAEGMRLSGLKA